ncbi:malto-oligosyltrehalose synthase [Streptomyces sp. TLI_146]|uniref:malto-oligosyltrehalose synthase n=1 Tax=Streptomyces sp. TLI_146 TaxID=1938858 RepID=UPI000C7112BA|nr:malto-oligosyltrehalose synthase [Streptomyces sp. TLI_146]PKV88578.1 maltooligosyl trehalose synthase [Streptomyces sp. TLI_146]
MTPTATYRLQLQPDFPFRAAERAVPYLASLGVSHLHLSPVLESVPGSTHGYDVVDHARVREELGGEDGLRRLARTARAAGLGLVLDIVPNHMAAAPRHNRQLWEVLREGPGSPYAAWFDIDWAAGGGKVLLPVLAGPIGDELDRLTVDRKEGVLAYGEAHEFPLRAGTEGLPLPELLDAQWYRIGWWRLARTELNYRRFFTISDLIGVRVEDEDVFAATHAKVLELVRDGVVDGLRVDHPDGLADPETYLRRLSAATGGAWTVVEKILARSEPLPSGWTVAGTTGYDALHRIDGLFTDPVGHRELLAHYQEFTGQDGGGGDRGGHWEPTARRAAYEVVTHDLAAEVDRLTRAAARLCARPPGLRDHAPWALRLALCELLVRMPVYRPYGTDAQEVLTPEMAGRARESFAVPEEASAVDAVRDLVLGQYGGSSEEDGRELRAFQARFAQTSSALRAKSLEDTAFYRYVALLSANEVGGDPGQPSVSPEEFHSFCKRIARDWPTTGTVLSTHDTKRSADVRARIAVLSECPGRWRALLGRLSGVPATDPQLAWTAWQTAVGLGGTGLTEERLGGALLKAAREAGLRTSWTEQDPVYERALTDFAASGPAGALAARIAEFSRGLASATRANVLGAALVHLTMPGVPDVYQGTESECLTLVDPDNRRPVDFPDTGPDSPPDEKGEVSVAALRLRRELPEAFGELSTYEPLIATGPAADHCLAFSRSGEVVTAVTRLSLRLAESGGWGPTELALPEGAWADVLGTGGSGPCGREFSGAVKLRDLFADRPVALLRRVVREGSAGPG